jgi:BTB/POZ domain
MIGKTRFTMLNGEIRERARRTNSPPSLPTRADVCKTGVAVISDLMGGLVKPRLCDLSLLTKDGVIVKAPRFMLGIRSKQLESLLFDECKGQSDLSCFEEYSSLVLNAMLEYCVSGELNDSPLAQHEDSVTARELVHLASFANEYGLVGLYDEVFKIARILMNRKEPLAAAFYDASASLEVFEKYALQIIEDSPRLALMSPDNAGIRHLSPDRLEAIIKDQSIPLEEMVIFRMVAHWFAESDDEHSFAVAQRCCKYINLGRIEPLDLLTTVRESNFFDELEILRACANHALDAQQRGIVFSQFRGPDDIERVLVTGAGKSGTNGMYGLYTNNEEEDSQPLYVKTSERSGGDFGVYMWESGWNLAPLADLSNVCYSAPINAAKPNEVPVVGWTTASNGTHPAPSLRVIHANAKKPRKKHPRHPSLPRCFKDEEELLGN